MPWLAERQRAFASALLHPAAGMPDGLMGPDKKPDAKRFAVYRNNVVAGLVAALKAAFPAVCRIVGDEFFRLMARDYALSNPPGSAIMLEYGAEFPTFVAAFAPAAGLPYLQDVAHIEQAWREAYHAAEAAPLGPEAFAEIETGRLPQVCLQFHPSLRVVQSSFPAATIWRMNTDEEALKPIDLDSGGETALVVRPAADVEVRSMLPGGADFVAALSDGRPVLDAAKAVLATSVQFDLSGNLAELIDAGAVTGFSFFQKSEHRAKTPRRAPR